MNRLGGINMSKEICCPLCGSKRVFREVIKNKKKKSIVEYSDTWQCRLCGCEFSTEEQISRDDVCTKISKKEFFSIIFEAIKDTTEQRSISKEDQRRIIRLYSKNLKAYYKEVAELQMCLFYEDDCKKLENSLFQKIIEKKKADFSSTARNLLF